MANWKSHWNFLNWWTYIWFVSFRDYWFNSKMSMKQWADERDADAYKFYTKWLTMKKLNR